MGVKTDALAIDKQTREDLDTIKGGVILGSLSKLVDMARKNSLWPMPFGL